MRENLRTWGRYAIFAALAIVIAVPALLILFFFILLSIVVVLLTSIPTWLGKLLPVDDWMRTGIHRWLDTRRMEAFRDDMLQIFRRYNQIDEKVDRYWMLREMGDATDRVDKKLRNGEFVIAFTAGVASIGLSVITTVQYTGVLLTVFAVIISLASLLRIVIVEILAYDPELYLESSHEDVAVRMGWNRGPINGRGAVLTALGTVFVGIDDRGYRLGKWILEELVAGRFWDTEDKWSS